MSAYGLSMTGTLQIDPMKRALELARLALGWSSPNPAVGAVLVRDGRVVGEGRTQAPGNEHAEIAAIRASGEAARGAVLFVTLEPCSHYGRTPPCTDALIAAGVKSVHAALIDPSPWVDGGGIRALEAAGIATVVGERGPEAEQLNEAYFKWIRTGFPFLTLKYAMTADGKIATRTGSSFWITGLEARRHVARLRSGVDAVLVGIGTVLADDPRLTARPGEMGAPDLEPAHQPLRVVMDSRARLPLHAKLALGQLPGKTLVCATERAPAERLRHLEEQGVETLIVPAESGRVDICAALKALGKRGVTSVLAECGGSLAASLVSAGAVDKVHAFVAPKIAGGRDARTPIEGTGVETMDQAIQLHDPSWTVLGQDVLLTAYVGAPRPPDAGGGAH
jgi:diaminohydroxyphosphoribosylaminopyrimidine deaminase/5-amino-6-(5-phosphoribosylamino)uracil reductase